MSPVGPSRHFACAQQSGRQVKADIRWQAGPAASVANDPSRKSSTPFAVTYEAATLPSGRAKLLSSG